MLDVPTVVTLAEMKLRPKDLFHHILTVGAGKMSIFDRQVTLMRTVFHPAFNTVILQCNCLSQGLLLCDAPIPNPPTQKALLADVNSDGLQVPTVKFLKTVNP